MILGITGSRSWTDEQLLWRALDGIQPKPSLVVTGGAPGADQIAIEWAKAHGIHFATIPPIDPRIKWHYLARNSVIVNLSTTVFAARMPGKSNGTDDAVGKARTAGKLHPDSLGVWP